MTFLTVEQAKSVQDISDRLFKRKNNPRCWTNNKRRLHGLSPLRSVTNKQDRFQVPFDIFSAMSKVVENYIAETTDETMVETFNNLCSVQDVPFGTPAYFTENDNSICKEIDIHKWRKFSDGWFTYYINVVTGEKKLNLEEGDVEVCLTRRIT